MPKTFIPKLVTVFQEGYSWKNLQHDLLAGIIVGIVAIPLSIAFAIASGVKPEQGILTAISAGFIISLLSGSRTQIGGPTGAFIVIVFDIVQKYGYEGLSIATIMAGGFLILLGLARFGDIIKFIPYPVVVGFTGGIALIIFTTQIGDLFGFEIASMPSAFIDKWMIYAKNLHTLDLQTSLIGFLALLIIVALPKVLKRVPASFVAIIVTTALVHILNIPVDTIGSRFGEVPNHIPPIHIPSVNLDMIIKMSPPALTIALLAGIESLLSAVVADGMLGTRHRSNMELIAQGVANIFSPIFNGIPATGAIARTATNIKNGGRTPVAGIIHAVVVLLIFLFFGKWASLIPMATLSAILIVVAYNMSEINMFLRIFRSPKSDILVLLATFFLTVLVNLTVAIEVGVVLASFLFMRRMVAVTEAGYITEELEEDFNDSLSSERRKIHAGVEIFEIQGPFFFGATDKFKDALNEVGKPPQVLILRMRYVPIMDATALHALDEVLEKTRREKSILILSEVPKRLLTILEEAGLVDKIGKTNIQESLHSAIQKANHYVAQKTHPTN